MKRRQAIASGGSLLLAGLAGCADRLGETEASGEAGRAYIPDRTYEQAGYERFAETYRDFERKIEVTGASVNVDMTVYQSVYKHASPDRQVSAINIFTVPMIEVLGQEVNPFGAVPPEDLITYGGSQLSSVEDLEEVDQKRVPVFGESVDVTVFEATVTANDMEKDVWINLTEGAEVGSDVVIFLTAYPAESRSEGGRQLDVITETEHEPLEEMSETPD